MSLKENLKFMDDLQGWGILTGGLFTYFAHKKLPLAGGFGQDRLAVI